MTAAFQPMHLASLIGRVVLNTALVCAVLVRVPACFLMTLAYMPLPPQVKYVPHDSADTDLGFRV